ncbi:hypothetical protein [Candidatus Spongiihabitans sp.]|uniref:hypothetical protein n=1 Tax=Candidatus Spongiihabitans sp. TaxID=3101308 RepID=UPI003C7AD843
MENAHFRGHEADIRGKEAEWVHIMKAWGIAQDIGSGLLLLLGIKKWKGTGLPPMGGSKSGPGGMRQDRAGRTYFNRYPNRNTGQ